MYRRLYRREGQRRRTTERRTIDVDAAGFALSGAEAGSILPVRRDGACDVGIPFSKRADPRTERLAVSPSVEAAHLPLSQEKS